MQLTLFKQKKSKPASSEQFQTPPAVAELMASMLPASGMHVLEPTPGIGNLVAAVEQAGHRCTAPADFFLLLPGRFDAVVKNPPFSEKYAQMQNAPALKGMRIGHHILSECMHRADIVIALMPWFTIIDSDVRLLHLQEYGIRSITTLPRKTFQYTRIQTMVLHLERGYSEKTEFLSFRF